MKRLAIPPLLSLFLALAAVSQGQVPSVPSDTGSKVPQAQAQAALDFHNKVRKDVGAPPLQWSPELAAAAQKWAQHLASDNNCGLSHTPNDPHGENLFGGSGAPYTALDASKDWYGEIKQYKYGPVTYQNFSATGHYTQMVWNTTTKVGIGQATCSGGGIVIAAEYDPHGNVIGQKPY
jgi:pathogenesis-related protein 1